MRITSLIGSLFLTCLFSACGGGTSAPPPPKTEERLPTGAALLAELERVRAGAGLPGLQVVVVDRDRIETASTGKRNVNGAGLVTDADPFQVGSLTKAASAMLIARLVEQHKLRWDASMGEVFPAWSAQMHPSMRSVTVQQLLRHRGGLQRDIEEADAVVLRPQASGNISADRALVGKYFLAKAPPLAPDSAYAYSNVGYLIVGLIAEMAAGEPYQGLMQKEVFGPMAMTAGFGLPEDAGAGALSGHVLAGTTWQVAQYDAETRLWLGLVYPAGGMMLSMGNYGKFLHEHLQGLQGKSTVLSQETFKLIHTPVAGYAFGWQEGDDPAHGGAYSTHNGTVGAYYARTLIIPSTGRAVAVSCNCAMAGGAEPVDRLVNKLAWLNP